MIDAYVPVMKPMIPKTQMKIFLPYHMYLLGGDIRSLSSQNVKESNRGGNIRAKHDEEKAPTRDMNKSSLGTAAATRTVLRKSSLVSRVHVLNDGKQLTCKSDHHSPKHNVIHVCFGLVFLQDKCSSDPWPD